MSVLVNANHMRKALRPIFVLATVLGVQMFEYRVVVLNYIHYIVTWSVYVLVFSWLWIWTDVSLLFGKYSYQFVLAANAISSLTATGLTLKHKKKFQRVLEDLSIINTSFGVLMDIPNGCSKLRRIVRKVIALWCITVVYVVISDASWMIFVFGRTVGPFIFLVIEYPYLVNTIVYIICCLILSYTKSKFVLLNEHIEKLTGQKRPSTCWSFEETYHEQLSPTCISKRKQDIWSLMHLHAELCKICRDLNTIFGVQITFEISTYFISVCGIAIYLCELIFVVSVVKSYVTDEDISPSLIIRLVMICSWTIIYVGRLIYFNHICETTSAEAHKTGKLMHSFLNSVKDSEVQAEVQQFILYMISRPLKFHGAGFFYFGYNFVYMFFTGIVTVLVITLQSKAHTQFVKGTYEIFENVTSATEILTTEVITPLNSSLLKV